jgi:hypothetical protein
MMKLQKSGLYDAADYIFVNVNGNEKMPFELSKVHINRNSTGDQSTEYYALKALYDYSIVRDCRVLFLHSKGVTWSDASRFDARIEVTEEMTFRIGDIYNNVQNWKQYIEYFSIDKWNRCVELLDEYDVVGTEWIHSSVVRMKTYNIPHYSGGVWWANSNYIRKLDPNFITNNMILFRFATELWVGTKNPNYYNFHTCGRNLYLYPILPEEYMHIN